ncbi:unnamed protein product [Calicophoron daubneyi]|uniref:MEIOB-like N-terminal domain-containing protein n=1 Tax=Calicophoron daubneyi TaxID=300641 RepID=A0AAV2TF74_CALDB
MAWKNAMNPKLRSNGLEAISIKDVSPEITRFNLIGIVIHKLPVKRFLKRDDLQTGGKRQSQAVLGFTLRDSLNDYINGSLWGTCTNVNSIASGFSIGDCVMVIGAKAKEKVAGSYESTFLAQTTSGYHLILSDVSGSITHFDFPDKSFTACLKSALVRPADKHLPLCGIIQREQRQPRGFTKDKKWMSECFTFFAAVADIGTPKTVILNRSRRLSGPQPNESKQDPECSTTVSYSESSEDVAELLQRCELTLFDETCVEFPMVLWNEDWIHIAISTFIPHVTTLSVVDCPVRFDNYRRGVVAVPNSRTLIIVAPECAEANRLSQYAKHLASRMGKGFECDISQVTKTGEYKFTQPIPLPFKSAPTEIYRVPLNSIHTIATIRDLKAGKVVGGYGITFALFTKMDLDHENMRSLVTLHCNSCQRRMTPCDPPADYDVPAPGKPAVTTASILHAMCTTNACPFSCQRFPWTDELHVQLDYGTMVNISDHTGTYRRTLLANEAMKNLVGIEVKDFITLSCEERARIKWQICLHRFKIYFWTEQTSFNNPTPLITIIACEKPNAFEVTNSLKGEAAERY